MSFQCPLNLWQKQAVLVGGTSVPKDWLKGLNSPILTTEFTFQFSGKDTESLPTKSQLSTIPLHSGAKEKNIYQRRESSPQGLKDSSCNPLDTYPNMSTDKKKKKPQPIRSRYNCLSCLRCSKGACTLLSGSLPFCTGEQPPMHAGIINDLCCYILFESAIFLQISSDPTRPLGSKDDWQA